MSRPLFSVIVRTKDRPAFLREALGGLRDQRLRDFEAVVVNDGADVADVIREFQGVVPIRYFHGDFPHGRCAAANKGIGESRGKYLAWLDDDDLYYPDHLETLAEVLERGDHGAAYTDAWCVWQRRVPGTEVYEVARKEVRLSYDFDRTRFFQEGFLHLVTFAHRRECTERLGGFDESLPVLEDLDFFFRLAQDYDFLHVKKVTGEYRIRDDGTNAVTSMRKEFEETRRLLVSKYFHMLLPELIKYITQKDWLVEDLMRRVQLLEQRLAEREGRP
jgi:glycosyltransferase involved in cell wall biosynthesis